MNRPFTKREKVMLVILVVLIIGIGYLKFLQGKTETKIQ